ncbi:MAG: uroporphyrinogen-III C-methyltransferase [candidate division Zixibacteria bacterium]|nr:uroporphyrinogen-III C-methyltransferase [candidate division Zixibacteria bacterium]
MQKKRKKGKVFLVGAGPGDPELLTLKGQRCIQETDVIIYDHLIDEKILKSAREGAELIYVGKTEGKHTLPQEKINKLLVKMAKKGKMVVRLKGGDPFVFGRGGEEALELAKEKIDFEIVPGVSSAVAVPAYAGIPVTQRGITSSLGIITGHEDPAKENSDIDWEKISKGFGTLVFLMGVKNLKEISKKLIQNGRAKNTPVALIRWGTTPKQETLMGTLSDIGEKAEKVKFKPPAVILVGEVVNLRSKLNWFEKKPLFGKKIVVTRSRKQASDLAFTLSEKGTEVIELPTIKIVPPKSYRELDEVLEKLQDFDWTIFTSVNGVEKFFERLFLKGKDVRELKGVKLCAIGPATQESLENLGLKVDFKPKEYVAESIVQGFKRMGDLKGLKILLPRVKEAREILPEKLKEMGAFVKEIAVYQTEMEKLQDKDISTELEKGKIDLITFTSSSTVTNFSKIIGEKKFKRIKRFIKAASIGPVTSRTLRELGINPVIQAKEYTIPGLVKSIEDYFKNKRKKR